MEVKRPGASGGPPRAQYSDGIDVLFLCTGNICRSPIAEALLRRRLAEVGVDATVHSAGLLFDGERAAPPGIEVLRDRGLDLAGHRSRTITPDLLGGAGLILGMTRQHVREAALLCPEVWPRSFTLKELVRRGQAIGARRAGEELSEWLARVHAGRQTADLLGASDLDDVADPIGTPRSQYERTADEIDGLLSRLVGLAWQPEAAWR